MKAAVLTAPERLEVRDVDEPMAGSDALIRVRSVGICGTDRKIFSGVIPVKYPRVLGHEVVGEVIVAPGDSRMRPGDRVLIDPGVTCGVCRQCREDRPNICTGGWLLGRDRDGGLRETIEVPTGNLHSIPAAIDDASAPLLQVLATCVHAERLVDVFPGDSVAIIGMGVSGLLHLQLAKRRGARPIVCVSRSAEKLAIGGMLGADVVIPADGNEEPAVREATDGGCDLAIECVGTAQTLARAVEMTRVGGRILSYGTVTGEVASFPFYGLYFKEIVMTSPRSATPQDFPLSIDLVASGQVRLEPLLSDRFLLPAAVDAISRAGAPGALKVVVEV